MDWGIGIGGRGWGRGGDHIREGTRLLGKQCRVVLDLSLYDSTTPLIFGHVLKLMRMNDGEREEEEEKEVDRLHEYPNCN